MSLIEEDNNTDGIVSLSYKHISTYDANGKETISVREIDINGDGVANVRNVITRAYDANGNVNIELVESDSNGDGIVDGRTRITFTHDANGNVLSRIEETDTNIDGEVDISKIELIGYDANGREDFKNTAINNTGDSRIDLSSVARSTYPNEKERIIIERFINPNGGMITSIIQTTLHFDDNGNTTKTIVETDHNADEVLDSRTTTTYTFDASGNETSRLIERDAEDSNGDGVVDKTSKTNSTHTYCPFEEQENYAESDVPVPSNEDREKERLQPIDLSVFPNPTRGRFNIQLSQAIQQQLQISDLLGQVLYRETIEATTSSAAALEVDLSDYQNGVYYIQLRSKGQRIIKKIIKHGLE